MQNSNYLNTVVLLITVLFISLTSCADTTSKKTSNTTDNTAKKIFPSDVIPSMNEWKILNGDGSKSEQLMNYERDSFFYTATENGTNWVVYKTPNSGTTSKTSSNTRTELHQLKYWTLQSGGKLNGTLKVKHVSTSGDARVAASYATVIGQIHSADGHKNEPLKIFYKKFPGHTKGSVFWNYEINTAGGNAKRWDYSTPVWGYDFSIVGSAPNSYPEEPADGIALDEVFSYEVNVHQGIMHLTFMSEGHPTKTFTKSLIDSDFKTDADIPEQVRRLFAANNQDGTEQPTAYQGEMQFFKQGAYNQTNGKDPSSNIVWSTGSEVYNGDLAKQYANGSYAEVWYKSSSIAASNAPSH